MKLKLLILVLGLQSAWILGTVFTQEHVLANGKVILLETRTVDPRDLLRGDYVTLSYKISDVPANMFSPTVAGELPVGTTVYVGLEQHGQFYEVVNASLEPNAASAAGVVLKGQSHSWWGGQGQKTVQVAYGLERYYVREGTGNPQGKITVQVAVPGSGRGRIKEVFVDGKPYAEAMRR